MSYRAAADLSFGYIPSPYHSARPSETIASLVFGTAILYMLKDWAYYSLSRQAINTQDPEQGSSCEAFEELLKKADENFQEGRQRYPSRMLQFTGVILMGAIACYTWSVSCSKGVYHNA